MTCEIHHHLITLPDILFEPIDEVLESMLDRLGTGAGVDVGVGVVVLMAEMGRGLGGLTGGLGLVGGGAGLDLEAGPGPLENSSGFSDALSPAHNNHNWHASNHHNATITCFI